MLETFIITLCKINKSNILHFVRVGNLPALLPNATLLVSRFFAKMSKKRRRCAVVNLGNNVFLLRQSLQMSTVVISNKYPTRISGKMGLLLKIKH
jgi:hypothetical protein